MGHVVWQACARDAVSQRLSLGYFPFSQCDCVSCYKLLNLYGLYISWICRIHGWSTVRNIIFVLPWRAHRCFLIFANSHVAGVVYGTAAADVSSKKQRWVRELTEMWTNETINELRFTQIRSPINPLIRYLLEFTKVDGFSHYVYRCVYFRKPVVPTVPNLKRDLFLMLQTCVIKQAFSVVFRFQRVLPPVRRQLLFLSSTATHTFGQTWSHFLILLHLCV